MCLPHCPTYRLAHSESASPRGRIALAAALARGDLEPDRALARHLNSCLVCLNCERNCPSGVSYARVIGAARELLHDAGLGPERPGQALFGSGLAGSTLRQVVKVYEGSGIQRWVRARGLLGEGRLARMEQLLPERTRPPVGARHPKAGGAKGRVQLFTGCTGELMEPETVQAAITVLQQLGYTVEIPPASCCGAMDHHAGDRAAADAHRQATLSACGGDDVPVVGIASGCTAHLASYGDGDEEGAAFAARVREITGFLADLPDLEALHLTTAETVAIHEPCSLRNRLRSAGVTARLFGRVGIETVTLSNGEGCCGAAGEHVLNAPETADRLRSPIIDALAESGASFLVSANIGCALHLAAGARQRGLAVEVLHPVVLLAHLLAERADDPKEAGSAS